MPHKVTDVLLRANRLLQDVQRVRWPEALMVTWVNDAIRRVIDAVPLAHFKQENMPLVPGVRQPLPEGCLDLLDVIHNIGGETRITPANSMQLDAEAPAWREMDAEEEVVHYIPPETRGQSFMEVYPPQSDPAGTVLIKYSLYPEEVNTDTDDLPIGDNYLNALVNFVCYRALDEDTNNQANTERAARYFAGFATDVGIPTSG